MLNELAKQAHETSVNNGFWKRNASRPVAEVLMLIVSEAAEALEEIRNGRDVDYYYLNLNGKPSGVPAELADIIIRTLDASHAWGIDIDQAVRDKMEYNKTRPYMHGKTL